MATRSLTPSRGFEPSYRLPPAKEREPADGNIRPQGNQGAHMWKQGAAPILHFSSGGDSPELVRFLRSFNEERNYLAAKQVFDTRTMPLRSFQEHSIHWILGIVNRSPGTNIHKERARRYQATSAQKAAFIENVSFELLMAGNCSEAKRECRAGLDQYPNSQGLWINFLVALNMLKQREAVEEVLLLLPNVVDINAGLLGVYLMEEPDIRRPVCNGG